MAQQQYIKHMREHEDQSINYIAETMKINWRTAKKYADKDNWNKRMNKRKKRHPVLGPYLDVIDTWLEEDKRRHKKQRHTQLKIYKRLMDECGFKGGQRTVSTYVSRKKKVLYQAQQTYLDLQHPGGEAQVDFGTAEVCHEQTIIQIKYLCMSFPYSNASYLWLLPSENIECFLTGLQRLFELVGGVPRKIWFDNLSAAVAKVENYRERKTTKRFTQFALHYGFQYEFCNVGQGHEKGNVENKVGFSRRNWMVPEPILITWEDLNRQMKAKAEEYLLEMHYTKKQPIHALFAEEKQKLLYLPNESFDVYRLETAILDKYGRVEFEGQHHILIKGKIREAVLLKIHWDEVVVLNQEYEPLGAFSRHYSLKTQEIDWKAQLAIVHKKPKAMTYAWIYAQLPQSIQEYVHIEDLSRRKKRIRWLMKWLDGGYSIDHLAQALKNTSIYQLDQEGVIYHRLYQMTHPTLEIESLAENYTPEALRGYDPDLDVYNTLAKPEVVS